jgi:hypothetical protein
MRLTKNQKRLRKIYTYIGGQHGAWNAYFKIDHQGFHVAETTSKLSAEWYRDMLAIALDRLIEKEVGS